MKRKNYENIVEDLNCRLCAALVDGELSAIPEASNKIFRAWNEQVMIPARGQLIEDHALIVTKRHFTSYGNSPRSTVEEYLEIETKARAIFPEFLEIEHGASLRGEGGGCIEHAHLHWFLGLGELLPLIASKLKINPIERAGWIDKEPSALPYIEIRNKNLVARAYGFYNEGQIIRRLVADTLQLKQWDWRALPEVKHGSSLAGWDKL